MPNAYKKESPEVRREALAAELASLDVRFSTICVWTGLKPRALKTVLEKYKPQPDPALPGEIQAGSISELLRMPEMRAEFAGAAGLYVAMGGIPKSGPYVRAQFLTLERAELMAEVYRAYLGVVPSSRLSIRQMMSAVMLLAGRSCVIEVCRGGCGAAVFVRADGKWRRGCIHCHRASRLPARSLKTRRRLRPAARMQRRENP